MHLNVAAKSTSELVGGPTPKLTTSLNELEVKGFRRVDERQRTGQGRGREIQKHLVGKMKDSKKDGVNNRKDNG